ncbi:DUF4411 family protein [Levilactobacillus brevis]|uniref:DUF4411 family protein n=1 Tax=Levilactobacillus brevis TaxID=1580 RepID=UPI001C1EB30E|nr:DUF4411 family protein [Levilactobacillus brevis]MBU7540808.1 DUF4411 family protein [Levilactobacillus brevis]MBU7560143.1 DUF4411 family protein [Levilactobacillus brevis]MBU7566968.1 DUF4411 family protein [Levilactobacillus brevis]MCE6011722.1 DUF4411 family protein [Levilactobacillus brevis]MCE6014076.1 DUF4411 family protein [Levilactobacillus brevis]
MSGYLIDSNILIVSNRNYRQDFFPVVWEFFKNNEDVFITNRVYNEIMKLDDELCAWTKANYKSRVLQVENAVSEYGRVISYVTSSGKWRPAGYEQWSSDANKADPWLIGYALKYGLTIVTDENNTGPNGHPTNNEPKIPFVADYFGVDTINFWELLSREHFKAQ